MNPDEACVVEDGSRDQGEHPHDDHRLLREPLLEESTNDTGPAAGAMKQDALREHSSSMLQNLVCDNSNEVEEEEEDSNGSCSSSSSSTDGEDHQQQQQQDSNLASSSGATNTEDTNNTIGKDILEIAIPALAGLAIDPFMTVMDTIFVGRTSTNAAALAGMGTYMNTR